MINAGVAVDEYLFDIFKIIDETNSSNAVVL